jgi:hypothetical protein
MRGPEDLPRHYYPAMRLAEEIGQVPVVILVCATAKGSGPMGSVIPAVQNLLLAARALGIGGTITKRLAPPVTTNRLPVMCITVLRCVPSRPLPRSWERTMVSDAASLSSTLRLCCPPWAWSMRDGMGTMQADVVAIRAMQCSAEALTGSLNGSTGTLHGLSLGCSR